MPKAFDRRQLSITHDPRKRISEELPKTPPFTGPTQMFPTGENLPTPIVQNLIDSIIQGFTGWFDQIGFNTGNVSDFSTTVAQALGTLGTIGLRLAKLEGTNSVVLEDFSTYPNGSDLGPKWLQWYRGDDGNSTMGITNKYAVFNLTLDTVNRYGYAIHKTPAGSDHHKVSMTCSVPQDVFGQSENMLIARANPVVNGDHVFAAMSWTKVRIGFVKNGQTTELASRNYLFRNGSTYSLDVSEDRTFRLFENSKEILTATDGGNQSSLGAGFQSTGFGTFAPNGAARPGLVGSFATYVT